MSFREWPKILSLNNVVANVSRWKDAPPDLTVGYMCKIKLHGTNGVVVIQPDKTVTAQSRKQQITPKADNHGFAAWVHQNEAAWATLARPDNVVYVCGEWCGAGINQGDAVCTLKEKQFAVFAARVVPLDAEAREDFVYRPDMISLELRHVQDALHQVHVLPWQHRDVVDVDLKGNKDPEIINAMVDDIGRVDPWVRARFDVQGPGEGVVAYPVHVNGESVAGFWEVERYMFKAKHARHSEKPEKKPARVHTEVSASAEDLARGCVTVARCDKGRLEVDPDKRPCNFGKFLGWLIKDVLDEMEDEMSASNVTAAILRRPLTEFSKAYWMRGVLPEKPEDPKNPEKPEDEPEEEPEEEPEGDVDGPPRSLADRVAALVRTNERHKRECTRIRKRIDALDKRIDAAVKGYNARSPACHSAAKTLAL